MGWRDRLSDTHARPFWYLIIEGIPFVFTNAKSIDGWSAPTCARHTTDIPAYTVLYDSLKVKKGIKAAGWNLNAVAGVVAPGNMSFQLTDTQQGTLRELFSTRLSSAATTRLAATLTWTADAGGDDRYQIEVDDTSDFSAPDTIYIGRETIYYDTIFDGDTFGDNPEDATDLWRGCYAWRWDGSDDQDCWNLDYKHWYDTGNCFAPETVSTNPRSWVGRRVVLCQNWFREQPGGNVPFDSDWRGNHEVEIWGGLLTDNPRHAGEKAWQLKAEPLTAVLDTELGTRVAKATIGMPDGLPWIYVPDQARPIIIDEATIYEVSTQSLDDYTRDGNHPRVHLRNSAGTIQENQYIPIETFWEYVCEGLEYALQNATGTNNLFTNWPNCIGRYAHLDSQGKIAMILVFDDAADYWMTLTFRLSEKVCKDDFAFTSTPSPWGDGGGDSEGTLRQLTRPEPGTFMFGGSQFQIPLDLSDVSRAFGFDFDSSNGGYAVLSTGEVVKYDSTTTTGIPSGYSLMTVSGYGGRGALGTEDERDEAGAGHSWLVDGKVSIIDALGSDNENIWSTFLGIACSTGGGSRESTYDIAKYAVWAARIDPSMLHLHTFERLADETGEMGRRTFALNKARNLKKWIQEECKFAQAIVTARTDSYSGRYRIGVYQIQESAQSSTLSTALNTLRFESALEKSKPVNSVSVKTGWHAGENKFRGPEVNIIHVAGSMDKQRDSDVKIEVPGLAVPWESAGGLAMSVASRIMARWHEPGHLLTLYTGAESVLYEPGQQINITVPGVVTSTGTVGYSAEPATVLGVEYVAYNPSQDWTCKVHVRVGGESRFSTYSPGGKVTGYNAGTPSITLADNEFSNKHDPNPWGTIPSTDAVWFPATSVIYCWNEGDWGSGEVTTVQSVSGSTLTISGAFAALVPDTVGGTCRITFAPYDSCTANQKRFVFIADNATPPTLGAASDEAYQYG